MEIFNNRNFMLLFLGQSVSRIGSRLYNVALMWYIYQLTGSSLALGISVLCFTIPTILVEPFAGVLADNFDRKKIIVITDVLNGLIMLAFSYFIYTEVHNLYFLYGFMVMSAIVTAIFGPAIGSTTPMIVEEEDLKNANSLNQLASQLINVLGPVLAGVLIATINISFLFFLNGVSFILSAISESFISIPKIEKAKAVKEPFVTQFKEGIRYVFTDKKLFHLLIAGGVIINFFLAPLSIYSTVLAVDILEVGSKGFGMINSFVSIGALVGAIVILANIFKDKYKLAVIGLTLEGVAVIMLGLTKNFYLVLFAGAILGLGVSMASVGIGTLYQTLIPKEKMGRALSLVSTLCNVTVPLGTLFGSFILEYISLRIVLVVSGLFIAATGLSLISMLKDRSTTHLLKPEISHN